MRLSSLLFGSTLALSCVADSAPYTLDDVQSRLAKYQRQQQQTPATTGVSHVSGCDLACAFLNFTLPRNLAYPNSTVYLSEQNYWSVQQSDTKPTCRFSPDKAAHVSLAVLTFRVTKCEFAVKSGGHAAFAGSSNIQDGVTIDLVRLDEITLSKDKKQTSIGPGNVWGTVYEKLTPQNLTVIGGRVSAIGVGGLTLGGGISFFSGRYGWACDNVNNYEVVFADGSIHNVNPTHYSDLYFALRGGGNNYGIVTRFDLATYPQGDLWAGSEVFLYSNATASAINNAFYWLAINTPQDVYAQTITAYAYAQQVGAFIIASDLQYGKPVPYPPIFKNFTDVPLPVSNTLRITDLPGLAAEFNATNPAGFRQTYWTFTVGNSAELMDEMVAIYMDEVGPIKNAAGVVPSAVFQPITTSQISHMSKNGGNPLGLTGQGPLNLINIDISWSDEADDKAILTAAQNMVTRSLAAAKARGLANKYLYQNYAAKSQVVLQSYGDANYKKLKAISRKYDPKQVWEKLQPGYFKLS